VEFTVSTDSDGIDFGASGMDEIIQNVRTIITTIAGTVPLARDFGVDGTVIDGPLEYAQARLTASVVNAIQTYEPRVEVISVSYETGHQDGCLVPTVLIRVRGEEDE